jgi:hypothetical protein
MEMGEAISNKNLYHFQLAILPFFSQKSNRHISPHLPITYYNPVAVLFRMSDHVAWQSTGFFITSF